MAGEAVFRKNETRKVLERMRQSIIHSAKRPGVGLSSLSVRGTCACVCV